jgi:predicted transcriptional regulator
MNKKQTPDEKLLHHLYQAALAAGDPFTELDARAVARSIGMKETALKNIVKHLAQANFIKKTGETTLCLTSRGCDFVRDSLEDI